MIPKFLGLNYQIDSEYEREREEADARMLGAEEINNLFVPRHFLQIFLANAKNYSSVRKTTNVRVSR